MSMAKGRYLLSTKMKVPGECIGFAQGVINDFFTQSVSLVIHA